jgi:hypothetical protein
LERFLQRNNQPPATNAGINKGIHDGAVVQQRLIQRKCENMNKAVWIFWFFLMAVSARGQNLQLFSAAGGLVESGEMQGSYTYGETFVSMETTTGFKLTQGFQQAMLFVVGTRLPFTMGQWETYPNPFRHQVFYRLKEPLTDAHIQVFTPGGVPVFSERGDLTESGEWDLSALKPGIYLLRVEAPAQRQIFQQLLIKQ